MRPMTVAPLQHEQMIMATCHMPRKEMLSGEAPLHFFLNRVIRTSLGRSPSIWTRLSDSWASNYEPVETDGDESTSINIYHIM